jgi:hypothetical protein
VKLSGLRPDKHYSFVAYQPPVSATVRVIESGPMPTATMDRAGANQELGPDQGLEGAGNGTLTVARGGGGGSLTATPPGADVVSGHWTCGTSRATGPPNRPMLPPATVPPVVNECSIGTDETSPPPPVTCPNGDLNVAQWFLDTSGVESAGPTASLATVEADMCQDLATYSLGDTFEEYLYSLSVVYYGWRFPMTPAQVLANADCSNST